MFEARTNSGLDHTRSKGVNVLICTRNDADHAEGVIGFLESELSCRELWLSVTWLDALSHLPLHASETIEFLWESFSELELGQWPVESEADPQELAWRQVLRDLWLKSISEEARIGHKATDDSSDSIQLGSLHDAIEEHLRMFSLPIAPIPSRPWPLWYVDGRSVLMDIVRKDTRRLL
jgi:hypothetical protein